jgi:hypothetical protein
MHWISVLTLDDHVVHDHNSIHDLLDLSRLPQESMVPDNNKTCSLSILPTTFQTLGKQYFVLQVRVMDCLHNCRTLWVDVIC